MYMSIYNMHTNTHNIIIDNTTSNNNNNNNDIKHKHNW